MCYFVILNTNFLRECFILVFVYLSIPLECFFYTGGTGNRELFLLFVCWCFFFFFVFLLLFFLFCFFLFFFFLLLLLFSVFVVFAQTARPRFENAERTLIFLECDTTTKEQTWRQSDRSKSCVNIQSKLDGSLDNSNSFLSPYEILPTAQENVYLGRFLISS